MNPWFERLHDAFAKEVAAAGGVPASVADAVRLTPEESQALLDVARDAAHIAGARQYAPLATYLAGRAAQAAAPDDPARRVAVIRAFLRAIQSAGPAGETGS